uniref:Tlx-like protein n=1 Tax=Pleurobrachia pileus TaxID=140457 RepID=Q70HR3_PLEPI|nr:Tlx-like protein [Pleurobrachia pileus]
MAKRLKLSFSIDQILGLSLDKSSGEARNHHGDAASQVMAMISSAGAGSLGGTEEHTAEYRLHSSPGSDGLNDYHSDEELKNRKRKRTRTTFSSAQVYELEKKFQRSQYLSAVDRLNLAAALSMSDVQVKRWFQNRRCKERHRAEGEDTWYPIATHAIPAISGNDCRHDPPNTSPKSRPATTFQRGMAKHLGITHSHRPIPTLFFELR